jgi:hypothetical protein
MRRITRTVGAAVLTFGLVVGAALAADEKPNPGPTKMEPKRELNPPPSPPPSPSPRTGQQGGAGSAIDTGTKPTPTIPEVPKMPR